MSKDPIGSNYLLRDIPTDLRKRANHKAIDEGISFRKLIFKALEKYLASSNEKS